MRKLLILLALAGCLLAGCTGPAAPTEPPSPYPAANPYDAGDFILRDGRMRCMADTALTGIDVSSHQGTIDWAAVAGDGIDFAMVRVGYRGIVAGGLDADANARANIEGALAAGLEVGVYFFSQAVTAEEAAQEAEFLLEFIEGYELSMPVVFDWEHVENPDARTAGLYDQALLTQCALAFLERVEAAGYDPMLYFNRYQAQDLFDLTALKSYGFWLAQYDADMDFPYALTMWQYTNQGTVAGIGEKVDLNLYFP